MNTIEQTIEKINRLPASLELAGVKEIVFEDFTVERSLDRWWACEKGGDGRNYLLPGNPDDGFMTAQEAIEFARNQISRKAKGR